MEHIPKQGSRPCGGGGVIKGHELEFLGAFNARCSVCGKVFDMEDIEAKHGVCSPRYHKWVRKTTTSDVCLVCGKIIFLGDREFGDCDWSIRGNRHE